MTPAMEARIVAKFARVFRQRAALEIVPSLVTITFVVVLMFLVPQNLASSFRGRRHAH